MVSAYKNLFMSFLYIRATCEDIKSYHIKMMLIQTTNNAEAKFYAHFKPAN